MPYCPQRLVRGMVCSKIYRHPPGLYPLARVAMVTVDVDVHAQALSAARRLERRRRVTPFAEYQTILAELFTGSPPETILSRALTRRGGGYGAREPRSYEYHGSLSPPALLPRRATIGRAAAHDLKLLDTEARASKCRTCQ